MDMIDFPAYGDSVVAGYGATPGHGFVPDLARIIRTTYRSSTAYQNFGVPGMTTFDLANALRTCPDYLASAHKAPFICVFVGGDDIIHGLPLILSRHPKQLARAARQSALHYAQILTVLRRISKARIVVGDIYNPYPATPIAESVIRAFNDIVIYPAAAATNVSVAPVSAVFSGRQAAFIQGFRNGVAGQPGRNGVMYPIHPNNIGHRAIAQAYASCL